MTFFASNERAVAALAIIGNINSFAFGGASPDAHSAERLICLYGHIGCFRKQIRLRFRIFVFRSIVAFGRIGRIAFFLSFGLTQSICQIHRLRAMRFAVSPYRLQNLLRVERSAVCRAEKFCRTDNISIAESQIIVFGRLRTARRRENMRAARSTSCRARQACNPFACCCAGAFASDRE